MGATALRCVSRVLFVAAACLVLAAHAGTVQYIYDGLGRLVGVIDENGQTTTYSYDAAGNVLSVSGTAAGQVSIVAFSPSHGVAGNSVTIQGSRFAPSPDQNTITFNGTPAIVSAATATTIVATVPMGATTGPIAISNVNGSGISSTAFTVETPPMITGVTPGFIARGLTTRAQISGSNLRFASEVTFTQPGLTAIVRPASTDQLLAVDLAVAESVPAGSYSFSVVNAAGASDSGAVTISIGAGPLGLVTSAANPLSVFVPSPPQIAPSGNVPSVSKTLSVYRPAPPFAAPSGDVTSPAKPLSVFLPGPAQVAPADAAMSVSQPVSVSVPQ